MSIESITQELGELLTKHFGDKHVTKTRVFKTDLVIAENDKIRCSWGYITNIYMEDNIEEFNAMLDSVLNETVVKAINDEVIVVRVFVTDSKLVPVIIKKMNLYGISKDSYIIQLY